MFGERRKQQRFSINRIAKFYGENGSLPRECTICDISEGGARLFTSGADIPDQFILVITGDKTVREECRVAWRLGGEVGVQFITKERELRREELINRLRAESKQALVNAR
jgi:hypothetical protein